jgi:hypothetical protein
VDLLSGWLLLTQQWGSSLQKGRVFESCQFLLVMVLKSICRFLDVRSCSLAEHDRRFGKELNTLVRNVWALDQTRRRYISEDKPARACFVGQARSCSQSNCQLLSHTVKCWQLTWTTRVRLSRKTWIISMVFSLFFCSRTPGCNFSSNLYFQSCWCIIQVIHSL